MVYKDVWKEKKSNQKYVIVSGGYVFGHGSFYHEALGIRRGAARMARASENILSEF